MQQPLVSAIMPVYNGEKYLDDAIESILKQTFTNFELIIINDGSTDRTLAKVNKYEDRRIKIISNDENRGIAYCRNIGLKSAKGEFVAWCDSDDISFPERFERQINFLLKNPDIVICGSWLKRLIGSKSFVAKVPSDPEIVKSKLIFRTSILNATSMWRLTPIMDNSLTFNENLPITEDYDFYVRSSFLFPMCNLKKVLYLYRASESSIMKKFPESGDVYIKIHKYVHGHCFNRLGIQPPNDDYLIHHLICSEQLITRIEDYTIAIEWLKQIKEGNDRTRIYSKKAIKVVLGEEFFFVTKKSTQLGLIVFRIYLKNCTEYFRITSIKNLAKLFIRCLIRYDKF